MLSKSDSIYYICIGSLTTGIIFCSLAMMGYFPNLSYILIASLITAFIMLTYIMLLSIAEKNDIRMNKIIISPFLAGILGTITFSSLALSTYPTQQAKSALVLIFLSSGFFTFMISYFYKLILYLISKQRHKNSFR